MENTRTETGEQSWTDGRGTVLPCYARDATTKTESTEMCLKLTIVILFY